MRRVLSSASHPSAATTCWPSWRVSRGSGEARRAASHKSSSREALNGLAHGLVGSGLGFGGFRIEQPDHAGDVDYAGTGLRDAGFKADDFGFDLGLFRAELGDDEGCGHAVDIGMPHPLRLWRLRHNTALMRNPPLAGGAGPVTKASRSGPKPSSD